MGITIRVPPKMQELSERERGVPGEGPDQSKYATAHFVVNVDGTAEPDTDAASQEDEASGTSEQPGDDS